MTFEVLDPTHELETHEFTPAPRLANLDGTVIGIVSNGKQGTRRFFDALARELIEVHGAADVVRATKTNYSAPADPEIVERAREWQALVAGVGD